MKQYTILIIFFLNTSIFAQNNILETVKQLIEAKKYQTAYKQLDSIDPNNKNPEVAIAKTELILNYFVTSFSHKLFALTDIERHEDILRVRGTEGSYGMFRFEADSILGGLIKKHPTNYKLHKALGYYNHEVHLKYGTNSEKSPKEVLDTFLSNYLTAHQNGVQDYWSLYGIAYAYITQRQYTEAITFFKKSIELKNDHAPSHYNLAIAYLYSDKRELAISSGKKAFNLYQDPTLKADAARVIAIVYDELKNYTKALEYCKKSNEISPSNYYTLKLLLDLELKTNSKYNTTINTFFKLDPTNPTVYQNLIEVFYPLKKESELIDFLIRKQPEYKDNVNVLANLYFYTATVQKDTKQFTNAKKNFEKASIEFKKVFDSNHEVFSVIEKQISEL